MPASSFTILYQSLTVTKSLKIRGREVSHNIDPLQLHYPLQIEVPDLAPSSFKREERIYQTNTKYQRPRKNPPFQLPTNNLFFLPNPFGAFFFQFFSYVKSP